MVIYMKYVRVMDGNKSNANGFEYKFNEVNIAKTWNPNEDDPSKFGGFNYSTYDKVLRWIHRGDTLVDVEIPNDAEWVLVDEDKGVYRTNKIIVKNPIPLTEDVVMDLYKKSNLPDRTYPDVLALLAIRKFDKVCDKLIEDKVNKETIDDYIKYYIEFENDINDGNYGNYFQIRSIINIYIFKKIT